VRATDLRFTTEEAEAFLNEVMELQLDPALVGALEARTEGWAAGLQLAALSARTHAGGSCSACRTSYLLNASLGSLGLRIRRCGGRLLCRRGEQGRSPGRAFHLAVVRRRGMSGGRRDDGGGEADHEDERAHPARPP
jgi:hypothetical protein